MRLYRSGSLILIVLLTACAGPIRSISDKELVMRAGSYSEAYQQDLDAISSKTKQRIADEYHQGRIDNKHNSFDILVLSGGGALGAFGAGFLQGWGEVEKDGYQRPIFDSVSGVSTGALIAPFAYVGSDEAYETIVELYRNPERNMVIAEILSALVTANSAVYDASKLHKKIKESVSDELVQQIAKGANESRLLLVGATNLDYGSMRVWDLADIAMDNATSQAREIIIDRLIASSAIPGIFPPVMINDNLYVDGGASLQFVSGLDERSWLYGANASAFTQPSNPDDVARIRIWIVINNKLVLEPKAIAPTWNAIAARSLESLMRNSTLQSLRDVETYTQLLNKRSEFDITMNYVAIPQSHKVLKSEDLFEKEKMRDLVELGRKMGKDPSSWQQVAIRPGASILDVKQ